jgi:hypothetical protein
MIKTSVSVLAVCQAALIGVHVCKAVDLNGDWVLKGPDISGTMWYADVTMSQSANSLAGHFDWDMPRSSCLGYGREYFNGSHDLQTHKISVTGYSLENYQQIVTSTYSAEVSYDGRVMTNGTWTGGSVVPSYNWSAAKCRVLESSFTSSVEGWVAPTNASLSWNSAGGDPGGCAQAAVSTGGVLLMTAPSKFLGNWTSVSVAPGAISIDAWRYSYSAGAERGLGVVLSGPGGSASIQFASACGPATYQWQTQIIPLEPDLWTVTTGSWPALLRNVTNFQVVCSFQDSEGEVNLFDNIRVLLPLKPLGLGINQLTDRSGGGGPCDGCCQIKHRQPILNAEGTAFMFASTWNKDAVAGSPNTNHNLEVFRCDISTGGFTEQTFTTNALSVPFGYAGGKLLFLSSSREWAANTDTNVEVFLFPIANPTNVQQITSTQGPMPIDLGTNTCLAPWFPTNQWPTLGNFCPDLSDQGIYIVWAANRNIPTASAPAGSNPDQNYEIFWMDLTSGEVRELTNTTGGDGSTPARAANLWPRVSRDGSRVVFVSDCPLTGTPITTNRYGIFLWDASRGITRCTTASVPVEREFPAFGMDTAATKIVFASDADLVSSNADGNFEIYTIDLGSGSIRQITSTTGTVTNSRPILSGDGKKIAFLSNGDFSGLNPDGSQELWAYHSDADQTYTDSFVQVTSLASTPSAREERMHWMDWYSISRDGSAIVMCSCGDLVGQNAANEYEIFLATIDWDPEPEVSITNLEFQPPGPLKLFWQGNRTNLLYTVESTTNLTSAVWTTFAPTNQWPVTATSWTNLSMPDSKQYFRVRATER